MTMQPVPPSVAIPTKFAPLLEGVTPRKPKRRFTRPAADRIEEYGGGKRGRAEYARVWVASRIQDIYRQAEDTLISMRLSGDTENPFYRRYMRLLHAKAMLGQMTRANSV